MRQSAGRYQRLSVQDAGFLDLEHVGLPQHVAILAVAEGGPLHDPDGRLRMDAIRQELAGRLQLVPRLRQRRWPGCVIPANWRPRRASLPAPHRWPPVVGPSGRVRCCAGRWVAAGGWR
jgi:hypothetical protein